MPRTASRCQYPLHVVAMDLQAVWRFFLLMISQLAHVEVLVDTQMAQMRAVPLLLSTLMLAAVARAMTDTQVVPAFSDGASHQLIRVGGRRRTPTRWRSRLRSSHAWQIVARRAQRFETSSSFPSATLM